MPLNPLNHTHDITSPIYRKTQEFFSNLIRILIAGNQCNVQNGFTHGWYVQICGILASSISYTCCSHFWSVYRVVRTWRLFLEKKSPTNLPIYFQMNSHPWNIRDICISFLWNSLFMFYEATESWHNYKKK